MKRLAWCVLAAAVLLPGCTKEIRDSMKQKCAPSEIEVAGQCKKIIHNR